MIAMSGSTVGLVVEQMFWLGQPAHAADFPAVSEVVPGQFSGSLSIVLKKL